MIRCKQCGGEGMLLGRLSLLFWYRCRQCGINFSVGPKNIFDEEEQNDDNE